VFVNLLTGEKSSKLIGDCYLNTFFELSGIHRHASEYQEDSTGNPLFFDEPNPLFLEEPPPPDMPSSEEDEWDDDHSSVDDG